MTNKQANIFKQKLDKANKITAHQPIEEVEITQLSGWNVQIISTFDKQ
jgi:hypothetical protein